MEDWQPNEIQRVFHELGELDIPVEKLSQLDGKTLAAWSSEQIVSELGVRPEVARSVLEFSQRGDRSGWFGGCSGHPQDRLIRCNRPAFGQVFRFGQDDVHVDCYHSTRQPALRQCQPGGYVRVGSGYCDWHYKLGGDAPGARACADLCRAEPRCKVFTYGEAVGCRYSACGSDAGPDPCPADAQCQLAARTSASGATEMYRWQHISYGNILVTATY